MSHAQDESTPSQSINASLIGRAGLGGVLMGLANLVPGISGGTMLLAVGVYPKFIDAVGSLSRMKLTRLAIVLVGTVVVCALGAIVLLAGPVKSLVIDQRWVMYSIFIGLTLGGVPVVWRLIGKAQGKRCPVMWTGVAGGAVVMVGLALVQWLGTGSTGENEVSWGWLVLAGVAGASAMILPGVSGAYLLLVMGAYVPILGGVSELKEAITSGDATSAMQLGWSLVLPVGLGVVVGIAGVSNLLKWLLHRFERATLGVLLGLLLGAVAGLYPYQHGVEPTVGDELKGQTLIVSEAGELVYEQTGKVVEAEDWPTEVFTPSMVQVGMSVVLIALGFAVTMGVDWIGRHGEDELAQSNALPDNPNNTNNVEQASKEQSQETS